MTKSHPSSITGSSSGIGRAIALECARHGANLVLHHIGDSQSAIDITTLKAEIQALLTSPRYVDVSANLLSDETPAKIVEVAISTFGKIDGLVNNAGICQFGEFTTVSMQQLNKHLSVNLVGAYGLTQAVAGQLISQGYGGSIISIASVAASMGATRLTHYSASKAAVLGMKNSCAVELGPHGIRVNTISPGTTQTSLNAADLAGSKREIMEAKIPLRRLAVPEDIAKPVIFFLSDMSQYVSGQNLLVDGAATLFYE
ncbi:unnamed protein product [Penicillium salamii]|nr:unnamed protein product [Penicillium salamii]